MKHLDKNIIFLMSSALLLAACSANSAWKSTNDSLDGAKCETQEPRCVDGYVCVGGACRAHNSVNIEGICKIDEVCKDGLVCVSGSSAKGETSIRNNKLVCKKECQRIYNNDPICSEDEFCAPLYGFTDADLDVFRNKAACLSAECTAKNDEPPTPNALYCKSGEGDCVLFREKAGRCFVTCSYDIVKDGDEVRFVVTDSPKSNTSSVTCHPVGPANNPTMVEWNYGTVEVGGLCDPIGAPCVLGAVCITGESSTMICHKLCRNLDAEGKQKAETGCDPGVQCQASPTGAFEYCVLNAEDEME